MPILIDDHGNVMEDTSHENEIRIVRYLGFPEWLFESGERAIREGYTSQAERQAADSAKDEEDSEEDHSEETPEECV